MGRSVPDGGPSMSSKGGHARQAAVDVDTRSDLRVPGSLVGACDLGPEIDNGDGSAVWDMRTPARI